MGEQAPVGRVFDRRRRANVAGGRQHRHEVKVSPEEEGMLLRRANAKGITVVRLLVESALAEDGAEIASDRRALLVDLFAAHRTLASLGNNVNQIAKATNAEGVVPGELVEPLRHTLDAVRAAAAALTDAIEELPKP